MDDKKYLLFWGHKAREGTVGAACLSQWWPAEFTVDGIGYATAEHWMMAAKARLFGDVASEALILAAKGPGAAKRLGRKVKGFQDEVWMRERSALVVQGNLAKFGQHADLAAYLLSTGDRVLVEASPMDRIWGIGLSATDPRAVEPQQWRGLNLLGYALMEVREQLRRLPEEVQDYPQAEERAMAEKAASAHEQEKGPVRILRKEAAIATAAAKKEERL